MPCHVTLVSYVAYFTVWKAQENCKLSLCKVFEMWLRAAVGTSQFQLAFVYCHWITFEEIIAIIFIRKSFYVKYRNKVCKIGDLSVLVFTFHKSALRWFQIDESQHKCSDRVGGRLGWALIHYRRVCTNIWTFSPNRNMPLRKYL